MDLSVVNEFSTGEYPVHSMYIQNISPKTLAVNTSVIADNPFLFSNELDYKLPITNQRSSGRCWLFATCNLIRMLTYQNWETELDMKVDNFELSQNYLYFYDKLERYHRSLRYYMDIKTKEDSERYMYTLLQDPMGDGGQWDMAKEIVKKYGIVPKSVYDDSYHSKRSREMNGILVAELKSDMLKLDKLASEDIESGIKSMMEKVYGILVSFLGKPPSNFNWTFKSKGKVHTWKDMTPKSFLEKSGFKPDEWVSVVNDPRKENEYNKYYQVKYLGNVLDQHVGWLNVPMDRLKELAKKSIDNKQPVWFGCDVGANHHRESGVKDLDVFSLDVFLNISKSMTKEERLSTFTSLPNHAMMITGYHSEDDDVKRWKIENSWGDKSGHKGYLLMTDRWMDEYTYQIVVHKDLLNEEEETILTTEPSIIPPWDPLGTLA